MEGHDVIASMLALALIMYALQWAAGRFLPGRKRIMKGVLWGILAFIMFFVLVQVTIALIIQAQVDRHMGFAYATPEGIGGEFFVLVEIQSGSVMAKAGLAVGDTLGFHAVDSFYRLLIENRGNTVYIPIRLGETIKEYPLQVPEMNLKYLGICVIY
jgi:hypothetical protein